MVNVTVFNLYEGERISPELYQDNHLHLVLPSQLKLIRQSGNVFTVKALEPGDYEIWAEQDYPRHIRSHKGEPIHIYDRIRVDLVNVVEKKVGGVLMIEGVTTLVTGCRQVICIGGGPSSITVSV